MFRGTDGTLYKSLLKKDDEIYSFYPDLCRLKEFLELAKIKSLKQISD